MINLWPGVESDLFGAIAAAWPEIGQSFEVLNVEGINWAAAIDNGRILPPWVVVHVQPAQSASTWGAANLVYTQAIQLFYIAPNTGDINATVRSRMDAMETLLTTKPSPFTTVQVQYDTLSVDVTEANPVNMQLRQAASPFTAGSVGFTGIFGKTIGG